MRSDIYILPVLDACLLYSPLQQVTALVNRKALTLLKIQLQRGGNKENLPESLQELAPALQSPVSLPLERNGSVQPMFLGILPTRACNISCAYCDFGASTAPQQTMDYRTATTAVDWMADTAKNLGWDTLEIHFFGGEPFFAGDVVDVVVHRARSIARQKGLIPHFEVSTNGVFDEHRARWIGDYIDAVVLSLDGFQEIHNRQRGAFDAVTRTARILSQSPAELCFRVCVTQESVDRLPEIVAWLCDEFQPAAIDIETLQPTAGASACGLYPPNPYDFARQYLQAAQIAAQAGISLVYASAATDSARHSFCPLGKDALIVSPDGRISACYLQQQDWQRRGLDLDVGQCADGRMQIDLEAIASVRRIVLNKPRCERCFCHWTCAGGCHVNESYPGCASDYTDFCIQTRILTACSLLNDLGFQDFAERFCDDRHALERLALFSSDALEDWEGGVGS